MYPIKSNHLIKCIYIYSRVETSSGQGVTFSLGRTDHRIKQTNPVIYLKMGICMHTLDDPLIVNFRNVLERIIAGDFVLKKEKVPVVLSQQDLSTVGSKFPGVCNTNDYEKVYWIA